MHDFTVLGSGSSGNAYILRAEDEILLLEVGVSEKEIKKSLDFDYSKVIGVLCTHSHSDHLRIDTANKLLKYGLNIYSNASCVEKVKGIKLLEPNKKYRIGSFIVQPIPVEHNVECYSFLIEHKSIGRCLFLTDLSDFTYKLSNIDHLFIEANYSDEIIIDNGCDGKWSQSASENHLEIGQTIDIINNLYSESLKTIVLLHLSDSNSNEKLFKQMVINETGFSNVFLASKGLTVELNKEDF